MFKNHFCIFFYVYLQEKKKKTTQHYFSLFPPIFDGLLAGLAVGILNVGIMLIPCLQLLTLFQVFWWLNKKW